MVETAREQSETCRWLKLYAGRGDIHADLDRLQAVRDAVGPDIRLFVDINTSGRRATWSGHFPGSRRSG
jgi:muconate cycloisomerase